MAARRFSSLTRAHIRPANYNCYYLKVAAVRGSNNNNNNNNKTIIRVIPTAVGIVKDEETKNKPQYEQLFQKRRHIYKKEKKSIQLGNFEMWGRLKGQVLRSRDEVDISDDDTIISRALLRFYEPEVPSWLASSNTNAVMQHQVYESASSKSPSPIPQSYSRRGSSIDRPRMFERSDSFATPASSTTSSQSKSKGSSSGLASRLKNSQW